jgi:glucokinase
MLYNNKMKVVTENGIRFRFKKKAILLSVLGTIGGTIAIAKMLGVTLDDVRNMDINQLVKLIPAYLISALATNHLIARTIRFADPVKGQRVKMVNGTWKRRRSNGSRKRTQRKSRKSRKSRRSRR